MIIADEGGKEFKTRGSEREWLSILRRFINRCEI